MAGMPDRAARRRQRAQHRRRVLAAVGSLLAVVAATAVVLLVARNDGAQNRAVSAGSADSSGTTRATAPTTTEPSTTAAPTTTTTVDPATLPQTEDQPAPSSPELDARAQALWQAIVADDPTLAMPFFFPLGAYEQVKAIQNPPADWQQRLVSAYERDIHGAHATLGSTASTATYGGISVPGGAQWVNPGQEYNKIGYWRVYGARLQYTASGQPGAFTLASMISWRGQWYVVHFARIE